MARKTVIKTNMLTPEQLNRKKGFLFSDLAFAIGVDDRNLELPYDGRTDLKDIFKKELEKFGLIIEEVNSLKKLDGKTGFILYGYYMRRTSYGYKEDEYHVLRANPDGTFAHVAYWGPKYDKPDEEGQIERYDLYYGPIHFFELVEERNKDIDELIKRSESVFGEIQNILNSGNLSDDEKKKLKEKIKPLRVEIGDIQKGGLTSNYVNIILEKALTIAEEYKREINPEERGQEQGS